MNNKALTTTFLPSIPEQELRFHASRSSGPGGQNVNKVNTRVMLNFDVLRSSSLTDEQKTLITQKLKNRINKDGILYLYAQGAASQAMNRADVVAKFHRLINQALAPRKVRKETRVSQCSLEKRLDHKKNRGRLKQLRNRSMRFAY